MKTTPLFVRQGDVLIVRVHALPATITPRPTDAGRVVLAYGEVTGHLHQVVGKHVIHYDAPDAVTAAKLLLADAGLTVEVGDANAPSFLTVEEETATVQHDEHAAIPLAPGRYIVLRQTEWSDALEPIQVAD